MDYDTDVFLSHNWGEDELGRDNHYRVSLINKELKAIGFKTWFDEERLTGEIETKISKGIEQTKGVIVFITRKYLKKVASENCGDYCRLEFQYASRKKTNKYMVPVIMENCNRDTKEWNGLIGLHLGGNMYVDMSEELSNKKYFSRQMENLQKQLEPMGIKTLTGILCFDVYF